MTIRKVNKPWGYEEIWAETDKYVAKRLVINPGHRLSLQYHEKKDETIRVISGVLDLWENDTVTKQIVKRTLYPGSTFHVFPGIVHRFGCDEKNEWPCILAEVSTPELDDVVRLEDDYDR